MAKIREELDVCALGGGGEAGSMREPRKRGEGGRINGFEEYETRRQTIMSGILRKEYKGREGAALSYQVSAISNSK